MSEQQQQQDAFERAVQQVQGPTAPPPGAAQPPRNGHGGRREGAGRKPRGAAAAGARPVSAPVQGPPPPRYNPTPEDVAATRAFLARIDAAAVRITRRPLTDAELDDGAREVAPVMPEIIGAMSPRALALSWLVSAYGPRLWDVAVEAYRQRRRAQVGAAAVARATGQAPTADGRTPTPAPAAAPTAAPSEGVPPAGAPFRGPPSNASLALGIVDVGRA